MNSNWHDKYKPTVLNEIIGNKKQIKYIDNWLQCFINKSQTNFNENNYKNAILITGPSSSGKTLIVDLLIKKYNIDRIEFNSSEQYSSNVIQEEFKTIMSRTGLSVFYNTKSINCIVIEGLNFLNNKKEFSLKDISQNFYYATEKFYKGTKILKKNREYRMNNTPIICICNNVDRNFTKFLKLLNHVKLDEPSDNSIYKLLIKIRDNENLNLNNSHLSLISSKCGNDYRQAINVMSNIQSYLLENTEVNINKILTYISEVNYKNMDNSLFKSINNIINTPHLDFQQVLENFYMDSNFIPLVLYENFIQNVNQNTFNTYSEKLDACIYFYKFLLYSQKIKKKVFNKWHLECYVGILSCASFNIITHSLKRKKIDKHNIIYKSSIISKYNYRFYNLKYINQISKTLNININNFYIVSNIISSCIFNDLNKTESINNLVKKFTKYNLTSTEFLKIIKLNYKFSKYKKNFTKKFQNKLQTMFNSLL